MHAPHHDMAPRVPAYDLVIFDCDGVLVDSEMLSAKVLMQQLQTLGILMTIDDFHQYFLGRKFSSAVEQLSTRTQINVPENFQALYFERLLEMFRAELQPMQGIMTLLRSLRVEHCVASSSSPPRLDCALKVCGLYDYFGARVYSAAHVRHAKPAPDLFLHAAKAHSVEPARCLVIEDSEMGIQAAKAAGMDVWQFTGGEHMRFDDAYSTNPHVAKFVHDMSELNHLFFEIGISQNQRLGNSC